MKVLTEPKAVQPRKILDEILRPHGLQVRSGPGGALLVVRARETPPATPAVQEVAGADKAPVVGPEFRETVTVSARGPTASGRKPGEAPPIVDVQNATVGTNFGGAMLRDIPNQRDVFALLAQTPGITMPRPDVGGNTAGTQSSYRAYGLSGQSITTVDGVNITAGADVVGAYIDYGALAEATVAAAGNSAEVPVAGAAVTTVIKSGSNTQHGEFYADFKPGGNKHYDGAENFWRYRDINGQLGGPFIKDRLWYFTSFRDQYTALTTGMFDRPAAEGGTQGQPFTTQTTDYTIKLNYQLSRNSTLTFMTQWGRKYQPYRFGSGGAAYQYLVESTALQDSWSEIGKVDYMRVISNRATLDTSINFYANQFPLTAHTDKTPIIDDVTFARTRRLQHAQLLAGSAPALQREPHSLRRPPRHEDRLHVSALRAAIHRLWRSGAGRHRRPLLHRDDQRRAELVLDRQRTGVEASTSSRTTRCSSRTSFRSRRN